MASGVKLGSISRESLKIDSNTEDNLRKMYTGDLAIDVDDYYLENSILKNYQPDPNFRAKVYTMCCINGVIAPNALFLDGNGYYDLVGIDMFTNLFIKRIKSEPQNNQSYTDQFIHDFNETMNDINNGVYSGTDVFGDRTYPQNVNELTIQQIRLLYKYAHKSSNAVDDTVAINFFAQKILDNISHVKNAGSDEINKMFNFESVLKANLDKLYPNAVPKPKTFLEKCFGKGCMSHGGRTRGGRTCGRRGTKKTRKRQRRSKRV
jgi:hypothetical protein